MKASVDLTVEQSKFLTLLVKKTNKKALKYKTFLLCMSYLYPIKNSDLDLGYIHTITQW